MTQLIHLRPGDRFRQPDLGITGELIKINVCRAYVWLDSPDRLVEFEDRSFVAKGGRYDNWSPNLNIELELKL